MRRSPLPLPSFPTRLQVEILEDRTLLSAAFVANEVLVQFKEGVAAADKANIRAQLRSVLVERIAAHLGDVELLRGPVNVMAAVALLKNNPHIAYAEPNWILSHQAVSNDPSYTNGSLWGMYSNDQPSPVGPNGTTNPFGSQAEKAWAAGYTGSNTVYIGIIDEGIQFDHPDLIANVWTNPFDPIDGIDNDGNGFVDDIHGWDFVSNDNTIYDGPADDHGTHVAGTIAAKGGNGIGVAGVNWDVKFISGKFLGTSGGTTANAIKALDYMTNLKIRHGLNIVATSNSWGGGGFSQGLLDAITRAAQQGILFIAAAGNSNSNNNAVASYPSNYNTTAGAGYDAVIAVAAIDSNGNKASFSSYGSTTVDLGAPGVGIISTVPTNGYASYNGTSMATPHVSGAAALYAAANPGATAAQIKAAILNSAAPTASLNGITLTGGRLDINALMSSGGGGGGETPILTIDDVTQEEGNSGVTNFIFTVSLSTASSQTVSVQYTSAAGTASAASGDYTGIPTATLFFAPNETSKTITVSVNGDTTSEAHENFAINLSNAAGAIIGDNQGVGTILNDDGLLSISNVTKAEGNSGANPFSFTVSLQNASSKTVEVTYATADGSASSSSDYTALAPATLIFTPGQTSKTVTVNVNGDTTPEPTETFFLNLSNPVNAVLANAQGVGTIQDDDNLPGLAINNVTGFEANTVFIFTVTLSAASTQTVTVQFATANGTATSSGSNRDYFATSGTLTFTPGQISKTIAVTIRGDSRREPNETFFVNLTNATNAILLDNQGLGTILNND